MAVSHPLCRRVIAIETRLDLSDRRQYINFQGGDMNLMRANHSSISHVLYALKLIRADGYISAQRMNKRFKPVCFGWMPWIQNSSDFTFRQSQFISNSHLCFARLSKTHKGGRFERGCDGDRYHVFSNLFSSRRRDIFAIINASANRHIQRIRGIFESLFNRRSVLRDCLCHVFCSNQKICSWSLYQKTRLSGALIMPWHSPRL